MRTFSLLLSVLAFTGPAHADEPLAAPAPEMSAPSAELLLAIPVDGSPEGTVFLDDAQAWNLQLCVGSSCLKYDSNSGFSTRTSAT